MCQNKLFLNLNDSDNNSVRPTVFLYLLLELLDKELALLVVIVIDHLVNVDVLEHIEVDVDHTVVGRVLDIARADARDERAEGRRGRGHIDAQLLQNSIYRVDVDAAAAAA